VDVTDQTLVDRVVQQLTLAGLPEIPSDEAGGGFAAELDGPVIYVIWSPSDELLAESSEQLESGNVGHRAVLHAGTIKHVMAEALLRILRSAGLNAALSTDDMAPATVEVRAH
jgi:hypothetical protein